MLQSFFPIMIVKRETKYTHKTNASSSPNSHNFWWTSKCHNYQTVLTKLKTIITYSSKSFAQHSFMFSNMKRISSSYFSLISLTFCHEPACSYLWMLFNDKFIWISYCTHKKHARPHLLGKPENPAFPSHTLYSCFLYNDMWWEKIECVDWRNTWRQTTKTEYDDDDDVCWCMNIIVLFVVVVVVVVIVAVVVCIDIHLLILYYLSQN